MPLLFSLTILAASLCGFIIAFYIYRHKTHGAPLVCPLNADCEAVVRSQYSTIWGFQNERLGLWYYSLFFVIHLIFLFYPGLFFVTWLTITLTVITTLAFAFSIYLLRVQFVYLREWCSWCLFASLCSTIIFLATVGMLFYR